MRSFTEKDTLGQIVINFPGAGEFFLSNQIDYGYHGDETLLQAYEKSELSLEQILTTLNQQYSDFLALPETDIVWLNQSKESLITYLSETQLIELRIEMSSLRKELTDLLKKQPAQQDTLSDIILCLNELTESLEKHLAKEEAVFFTVLSYYLETNLLETLRDLHSLIDDLDSEHEQLTELIQSLRSAVSQAQENASEDKPLHSLLSKTNHLTLQVTDHIHLENNLLFKTI